MEVGHVYHTYSETNVDYNVTRCSALPVLSQGSFIPYDGAGNALPWDQSIKAIAIGGLSYTSDFFPNVVADLPAEIVVAEHWYIDKAIDDQGEPYNVFYPFYNELKHKRVYSDWSTTEPFSTPRRILFRRCAFLQIGTWVGANEYPTRGTCAAETGNWTHRKIRVRGKLAEGECLYYGFGAYSIGLDVGAHWGLDWQFEAALAYKVLR
jgi:hypothetical protein